MKNSLLICIGLALTYRALADYHYPPVRLDCKTAPGNSITFFTYATNNESRKKYNGNLYVGPLGEQTVYGYDEIIFSELPKNALSFKGTPIEAAFPKFEMHLDRSNGGYIGSLDLIHTNGQKEHWIFQLCTESGFSLSP